MNKKTYALLFKESQKSSEYTLQTFEDKKELDDKVSKLHHTMGEITNQRMSYFADVFDKNAYYPDNYTDFSSETNNRDRKSYHVGEGFFVRRTLKNGKIKDKFYNFMEDFDWQLDEWKEKGCTNIIILNMNEALSGEYYYESDIEKRWGKKKSLLA